MSRRGHSLYFFLTPAEQVALLEAFETRHPVAYYRAGTSAVPDTPALASLLSEPALGYLTSGDWNHSPSYLLTFPEEGVAVRKITLQQGSYAYAVDQGENSVPAAQRPVWVRYSGSGFGADGLAQFLLRPAISGVRQALTATHPSHRQLLGGPHR